MKCVPKRLLAALLLVYICETTIAEEDTMPDGTVYGHVFDSDTKQPLSQAFVYCQEVTCSKPSTDSTGYFAIENCFAPTKTYTIRCTKHGYKTATKSVMMDKNGNALTDFDLVKSIQKAETDDVREVVTDNDRRSLQEYMQNIQNTTLRTNEYWDNSISTCTPGSIQATCSALYSCVDCNGKCYAPGEELNTGIVCTAAGKWNRSQNCPSECGINFLNGTCACPKSLSCTGIISGHIVNIADGGPVPRAKIYIRDSKDYVYSGTSDDNGYFRSSPIFCPSNPYDIICDTFGYVPAHQNVVTEAEGSAVANLSISQEFEVNPETCAKYGGYWRSGNCTFGPSTE